MSHTFWWRRMCERTGILLAQRHIDRIFLTLHRRRNLRCKTSHTHRDSQSEWCKWGAAPDEPRTVACYVRRGLLLVAAPVRALLGLIPLSTSHRTTRTKTCTFIHYLLNQENSWGRAAQSAAAAQATRHTWMRGAEQLLVHHHGRLDESCCCERRSEEFLELRGGEYLNRFSAVFE
jgi:hypothetical protein